MAATTADVLDMAADLVAKGWCQGDLSKTVEGRTCYCLMGALYEAALPIGADTRTISRHVHKRLRAACPDYTGALTTWNDALIRTQAEVVQLLRDAAREARGE